MIKSKNSMRVPGVRVPGTRVKAIMETAMAILAMAIMGTMAILAMATMAVVTTVVLETMAIIAIMETHPTMNGEEIGKNTKKKIFNKTVIMSTIHTRNQTEIIVTIQIETITKIRMKHTRDSNGDTHKQMLMPDRK